MTVQQLMARWREDAGVLRRRGATSGADLLEQCATELEHARLDEAGEELTVAEAAQASGYSEGHVYRLIAGGSLPNKGRKGAPRVSRGDLPRKLSSETSGPDLVESVFKGRVA